MTDWPTEIFAALTAAGVRRAVHVPDSGHSALIRMFEDTDGYAAHPMTTEEEGVAFLTGSHLGGENAVLLMQSSGVGNCVNMLSLVQTCGVPMVMLVTMRGEWGEFNPWQVPMGSKVAQCFEMMNVSVLRIDRPEEAGETVGAAARSAFAGGAATAVLIGQRVVGSKVFVK